MTVKEPDKTPNRQGVGKDVGLEVGLAEKIMDLILEDSEIKSQAGATFHFCMLHSGTIWEKEKAEEFEKALCDETGKKAAGFTPYQITFCKADGSAYTLWHLILEAEGAGKDQKLAVMTRDGKIRISDTSSEDRLKITSETIAAAALFSAG